MNNKVLKEILIIALLCVVVIFCLGILFYDAMSVESENIESITYATSQNVSGVLTEIQSNSGVDIKNQDSSSLLKSYSIGKDELDIYASDKSYESGKKDPFAEYSDTIEEVVTTTTRGGVTNPSQTGNPVNTTEAKKEEITNTLKNGTANTVKNTVKNEVAKDKVENKTVSSSTVGTFFENKNSK